MLRPKGTISHTVNDGATKAIRFGCQMIVCWSSFSGHLAALPRLLLDRVMSDYKYDTVVPAKSEACVNKA